MPTTFAHRYFGQQAIGSLDADMQAIINENRKLYDVGLHGPDIFFYYNGITSKEYYDYGCDLHEYSMKQVLELFQKHYNASASTKAYIAGVLGHWALDNACHNYIENKIATDHVSHSRIEQQFDWYLVNLTGRVPYKTILADHIYHDPEMGEVIAPLYDDNITPAVIVKTLKDMRFILDGMVAKNPLYRWFLFTMLDAIHASSYKDLIMEKQEVDICKDSNLRLYKLFNIALADYPAIVKAGFDYLDSGIELPDIFNCTFDFKANWQSVPVLPLEQEKNYEVEREYI